MIKFTDESEVTDGYCIQ